MAKRKESDLFDEEEAPKSDFASLFERSLDTTQRRLSVGDQLRAEILSIGKEESYVSTGTPIDAVILNADLLDENKQIKYNVGESIDVVVLRVRPDEVRVTRKGSKSAPVDIENLEDAFDMELPVEGKVSEKVNGGFRVLVQGQPAFCPISQMDSRPIVDQDSYLGKKFEFIITQFDTRGRNIVVSRRKLLSAQQAENEGTWMSTHKTGDIVSGEVMRVEQYGAFVRLESGVEGLVHVSELGYVRLKHANEAANVGDKVQVKILNIDEVEGRLKIALSVKQAGGVGDPWMMVPQKFPVGTQIMGVVDKREPYGLFIVVTPGINGLLPKSKWRDSTDAKIYENARVGESIKVRVDEIKFEERKMSLGLPTEEDDGAWKDYKNTQSMGSLAAAFASASSKSKK